ncbi:hypothetical protein HAX54_044269 [Datura stramonium]|uniref:Uncharacterized protein n=1 Tax=Datura stramonium TaxID=4076 RepID=A0ABS8W3S6_DATST|nr:hypothetical protein [Datura stramonium]
MLSEKKRQMIWTVVALADYGAYMEGWDNEELDELLVLAVVVGGGRSTKKHATTQSVSPYPHSEQVEMPIDEVDEGSLLAACMVVFCLMITGREIDCNPFRPIGYWVGATGGRQHEAKQRAELQVTC